MNACQRIGLLLDAYHDGELGRLRRFRVRRHVARCGGCREELDALAGIGAWVRESLDAAPPPDLWDELRWQLPARRPQPDAPMRERLRRVGPIRAAFGMPVLGAGVVAAGVALSVLVGPPPIFDAATRTVVRSLNTHGRPVMVLDGPGDATIIWLMDDPGVQGAEDSASVWI
jgi:anti-sigma factor RsiW